jgi:hypothetical protein
MPAACKLVRGRSNYVPAITPEIPSSVKRDVTLREMVRGGNTRSLPEEGNMTDRLKVGCINKRDRQSRHERIHSIGGNNGDGTRWKLTEEEAIAGIESGKWSFYTVGGGESANVIIANHLGRKYLRTDRDSTIRDNLLSLPECP